ncbi:MAG: YbaK/EbsC family protein [Geovibrio sp.]|jgi:prolyl-tRNA editing enzyme YbaK/EbsC (Cys-tRNA(Pro) deacylase)|uniref:YbaK/EbsC family protein n=1 Tax=Geovibrio ferrireducens TaxID=46201 RepID=UPI002246F338|nr:YbaK/EbsC family protein [Geovibrio ferrireducens]MCD8568044.1 YbaK/EbsC family protein [Geovibrio sp.]
MKKPQDSVAKVAGALRELGVNTEVLTFSQSTKTSQEAADAAGCELAQIAKSIVFRAKSADKAVLVITSGVNRVDTKLIRDHLGEKPDKADADFVREKTGYVIGGVPAIAHKEEPIVFLDETLMEFAEIWSAAGSPYSIYKITPQELLRITGAKVIRVC